MEDVNSEQRLIKISSSSSYTVQNPPPVLPPFLAAAWSRDRHWKAGRSWLSLSTLWTTTPRCSLLTILCCWVSFITPNQTVLISTLLDPSSLLLPPDLYDGVEYLVFPDQVRNLPAVLGPPPTFSTPSS